jgi:hypothetical protein
MAMTKKQLKQLEDIQMLLLRSQAWLMSDGIAVARAGNQATTDLHFVRPDGATLYPVDKEIGSDLALLHTAIAKLNQFINQ